MDIPRTLTKPAAYTALALATALALLFVLLQGTAGATGTPPAAPANPLAHVIVPEGEAPRIRVSWDTSQDATGYTVSRSDGESFNTSGSATTYSDTAVNPGTAYTYTVAAKNESGTSSLSDPASTRVPDAPSARAASPAQLRKYRQRTKARP